MESPFNRIELDFESQNWNAARTTFMQRHKDNDTRKIFLSEQTTGPTVKEGCLKMQNEADNKYAKGLGGILSKIDTLMKVGDLAIKSAPESVGLAWMGIRLCLHSVQDDFATFTLFSGACADIIGIMISCRVYGKMYGNRKAPEDFQEIHNKVVGYIPDIYADILDFSYAVRKHMGKALGVRVVKGIFSSSKSNFQGQIDNIQQHETKMREFARTATDQLVVHFHEVGLQKQDISLQNQEDMKATLAVMNEVMDANNKAQEIFVAHIQQLEEERKNMKRKTPYDKAKEEFEENKKLLNPSADQISLYAENLERREENTCKWIFEIEEYAAWFTARESSMLWVSGGPGFGKSILMSTVIQTLKAAHTEKDEYNVQYFFCKTGDDATQAASRVMQNMVYQLYALSQASPDLLDKTNEVLKKASNKKSSSGESQLGSEKKTINFQEAYEGLARVYGRNLFLVVDALDECTDRRSQKFISTLRNMTQSAGIVLKIIVCSRPETDISEDLVGIPAIKLEGRNEQDIRKNVTSELDRLPGWTASEKALACDEVVKKAGGQFRYVDLALKFLRQPWQRPLEKRLRDLPAGLYNSYIQSLQQTDPGYIDLLQTSLTWTILAAGEVKVPEIMDAYSRAYDPELDVDEIIEETSMQSDGNLHDTQIRIAGGSFLEVASKSRVISLRHTTVKDFFLREDEHSQDECGISADELCPRCRTNTQTGQPFKLSLKDGHLEIAKTLVRHLSSSRFQKKYLPASVDKKEKSVEGSAANEVISTPDAVAEEPTESSIDISAAKDEPAASSSSQSNDSEVATNASSEMAVSVDNSTSSLGSDAILKDPQDVPNTDASSVPLQNEQADSVSAEPSVKDDQDENNPQSNDLPEDAFLDEEDDFDGQEPTMAEGTQSVWKASEIRYEISQWTYHLKEAERLWSKEERDASDDWAEVWRSLETFICDSPAAFMAWQKLQWDIPDSPLFYNFNTFLDPLHIAVAFGLTALAERLITRGEKVSTPNAKGEVPLSLASGLDLAMLRLLLENGADPNDPGYSTPFHLMQYRNPTIEMVELFLRHDAKCGITDNWGLNGLHFFSLAGSDPKVLQLLLTNGADINVKDSNGETPLHYLVRRSDLPLELLEAFLEANADVNIDDNDSQRPLYEVATEGNIAAVKMLLEHKADIHDDDKYGMTALHAAAVYGHADAVKLFLEKGAAANKPDKYGRTPFFLACQGGHTEAARCLLEALQHHESDTINKMSIDGKTPLRKASARGNLEIVKMLLEKIEAMSAVNAKDLELHQTPLHSAAYNGHNDVVEMLLDAGADTNTTDKNGRTPVDMCAQGWAKSSSENAEATLILLLDKDIKAVANLGDILCIAAVKGSNKVIEKLLDAGADPNLKDEHGWTPLLLARQYQQKDTIELLSKNGAVIRTKPTKWITSTNMLNVSEDGLKIEYTAADYVRTSVVSNHPIPAGVTKYYFEIEILKDSTSVSTPCVGIGLCTQPARLHKQMPGHYNPGARTWAYHGDDGYLFDNNHRPKAKYGTGLYGPSDVIGCGVDFEKGIMFYTNNGKPHGIAFENVGGRLHPVIGFGEPVAIRANFGNDLETNPFKWGPGNTNDFDGI